MVMNSTSAVEISIQAVSPLLMAGAAAASWAMARPGRATKDMRAPSPA